MQHVKKADDSLNFAMGGIHIHTHTHHNSLGGKLCDGLQGSDSCDATSHAQALPALLH
jgi:hypothetical protein